MSLTQAEYSDLLVAGTRAESGDDPVIDPLAPDMSYGVWEKIPALDSIPRVVPRLFDTAVLHPAARRLLNDPVRDTLILRHILVWSLLHLPCAIAVIACADCLSRYSFWALTVVHLFLWFTAMDTYVLGLHCISHRRIFTEAARPFAHFWYVWVLGPIFGETPETYYAHHIGMHHPFNNGFRDLSCTMTYRRDSFAEWLCYFGRFLTLYYDYWKLMHVRNPKVMLRFFGGELAWLAFAITVAWPLGRPYGALVALVVPVLVMRGGMMAGNWGQHAFINPNEPTTNFGHSVNIVGSSYNRRCFNDGYHIIHHIYPNAHYTELPLLYARDIGTLREHDCLVFEAPDWDFTTVWWYCITKNWDVLAHHMVDLGHGRSHEQKVALLKERAQRRYVPGPGGSPLRGASVGPAR